MRRDLPRRRGRPRADAAPQTLVRFLPRARVHRAPLPIAKLPIPVACRLGKRTQTHTQTHTGKPTRFQASFNSQGGFLTHPFKLEALLFLCSGWEATDAPSPRAEENREEEVKAQANRNSTSCSLPWNRQLIHELRPPLLRSWSLHVEEMILGNGGISLQWSWEQIMNSGTRIIPACWDGSSLHVPPRAPLHRSQRAQSSTNSCRED